MLHLPITTQHCPLDHQSERRIGAPEPKSERWISQGRPSGARSVRVSKVRTIGRFCPQALSTRHLIPFLRIGVDGLLTPPNLKKIPTMSADQLVTDVLSLMKRQQDRLDGRQVFVLNNGRAHALLVHYPDVIAHQLKLKQKGGYVHLDTYFRSEYGCSIDTVLNGTRIIYMRYSKLFTDSSAFNPPWLKAMRQKHPDQRLPTEALGKYLHDVAPHLEELVIEPQDLKNYLGRWLPVDEIDPLLSLLSATVEEVRDLLAQPPYASGITTFAPLPLEIKPLILLPDGHYVIPNARSLLTGMARLPLLALTRAKDNNVFTCYGASVESYALAMTEDRTAGTSTTVVPEYQYRNTDTGKDVLSADITLLEVGHRRVLVETKATRVPESGMAQRGTEALTTLDNLITKTVLSGLDKARHLPLRPPPSQPDALTGTLPDDPLVVVVYGETFSNFDVVFRSRIRTDANHPLRPHLGRFLALSLEEYEHHLEIARDHHTSVIPLLTQSADEFRDRDALQLTSHRHLGNAWPADPFVERFDTELLGKLTKAEPSLGTPVTV